MLKLKLLSLLCLSCSSISYGASTDLTCEARFNLEPVLQKNVTLHPNEKNVVIGDFNQFTFFISSKGENLVELQVLNHNAPSRSYATANLNSPDSFVDLAIWTREFLLEVRCSR
jgi:hypothetical protein